MGIKNMRVGVVFDGELTGGGAYQQQLSTVLELKELGKFEFIIFTFFESNKDLLDSYGLKSVVVPRKISDKIFSLINRQSWFYSITKKFKIKSRFEKILDNNDIDLVHFLSPLPFSLDLVRKNYILTVWDLCHRDTPEFPEVSEFRNFESRELLYCNALKKATGVIVDSELGKRNVVRRYGIDENRVYSASFSPSVSVKSKKRVDVKSKYNILGEYIYYPAQFWPHKNHVYIVDALSKLKSEGIEIKAVFSGSNQGNLDYVLEYAKKKNVEELIEYIGFAPNEEIYSLYKNSLALVMPSYFGPTNIPPLEAFFVGTPVIYSAIEGFKEQVGDAALFCNLNDENSLANHLKTLMNNQDHRETLIAKGKERLLYLEKKSTVKVLEDIFNKYEIKLKCWK